jgi:uncharacterized membrane protein YeiH
MMDLIYALDLAGTLVFAISGAGTAASKRFDVFGALVIAFVTAVGGGTLRDMLIGSQPVGWMLDPNYLFAIAGGMLIYMGFRDRILRLRRTLFLFDTVGIALFTILGIEKTLDYGLSMGLALMMGVVSAVFGGVVRDTLCNVEPLIFRGEVYATACLAGGLCYLGLNSIPEAKTYALLGSIAVVFVLRTLAVRYHWTLPVVHDRA